MNNIHGKCLCGKVELIAVLKNNYFDVCHCKMCQSWGGGPAVAVEITFDSKWVGEEHIKRYDSSDWAQRGFCSHCGSHLFYQLKDKSYQNIPMGLLQNPPNLKFKSQIFIDKKPDCYFFGNQTENLTEEDFYKKYNN